MKNQLLKIVKCFLGSGHLYLSQGVGPDYRQAPKNFMAPVKRKKCLITPEIVAKIFITPKKALKIFIAHKKVNRDADQDKHGHLKMSFKFFYLFIYIKTLKNRILEVMI